MATTTAFGWSTPDDTSLVKDGAAAIRTLGQSIDTSMAELKGGTTGQVLSKTSNTDMDFTWVAQDDSNAIQNVIVDAKGDLIAATANDTPARLAVGNNGETLVADSSTATGLRYTAGNPIPNPVINSCMDIAQRGTSFTATSGYVLDRWYYSQFGGGGGITITQQATADTTNLPNIQYSMRIQRNSGSTTTNPPQIAQSIENANAVPFAGKTVTFSFYARAGANYSSGSSNLNYQLRTGTGTDQNTLTTGFTGQTNILDAAVAITTTWGRYSFTATVGATAKQIAPYFYYAPTGTAGTNDWVEITGVQIDIGSVALPVRRNAGTIQGETYACQYYFKRIQPSTAYAGPFGFGYSNTTTQARIQLNGFSQQMRTSPSVTFSTASNFAVLNAAGNQVATATSSLAVTPWGATATITTGAGTQTAGQGVLLADNGTTSATIDFSAEL